MSTSTTADAATSRQSQLRRDAVRCSRAIHDRFPPNCTHSVARLRISLNTGPCIAVKLNANIDYFGGTVNVAAKLQSLAAGARLASQQLWGGSN